MIILTKFLNKKNEEWSIRMLIIFDFGFIKNKCDEIIKFNKFDFHP